MKEKHFNLDTIINAKDFEKLRLIKQAADIVCENLKDKKTFETYVSQINHIKIYLDKNDRSKEHSRKVRRPRGNKQNIKKKAKTRRHHKFNGGNKQNHQFLC